MLTIGVDTYVTIEEADEYVSKYYVSTDDAFTSWGALMQNAKEVYLRRSALEMNSMAFAGRKCSPDQPLAFPRIFTSSRPGIDFSSNIPEDVKIAQIENAISMGNPKELEDAEFYQRLRKYGIASYHIGNLSETLVQWSGGGNNSSDKIRTGSLTSPIASVILQQYLVGGVDIR